MSELLPRMPALFFGHGSPMNALGGPYADTWRALGEVLPVPKSILMVSAHWFVDGVAVTAQERPRTIHDFYGFPKPLYGVEYPAPGDPWLVDRVRDLLGPLPVRPDHDWGLDHGTWSVLAHVFPRADVPVIQLSIDRTQGAAFHYALARQLRPLRDEGVLIAGSGDVVHNLRVMRRDGTDLAFDWADRFNALVKDVIVAKDHAPLIDYLDLGDDAVLSVPTPEHFLPLLYVLAQQDEDDAVDFFNDRIDLGSISMLGVRVG